MGAKRKPKSPEQIALAAAHKRAAEHQNRSRPETWGVSPDTLESADRRGEVITEFPSRPGERHKPPKRLSGLDWLLAKGRLAERQMVAGLKYGDDYRASTDVHLRSCLNDTPRGGDTLTSMEVRQEAGYRLRAARSALSNHEMLVWLMDEIAGEGRRVRDLSKDDAEANRVEASLLIALDLLVKHYGVA